VRGSQAAQSTHGCTSPVKIKPIEWRLQCSAHVVLLAGGEPSAGNMTDLLQVAGEVGKAVETLVTIMTDEEQRDQNGQQHASSQ